MVLKRKETSVFSKPIKLHIGSLHKIPCLKNIFSAWLVKRESSQSSRVLLNIQKSIYLREDAS